MASTAHINSIVKDSNVSARLAHVALAAQVEQQGSECARALYAATVAFNADLFDGRLLPLFVEVTPPGSLRALADYRPRTHEGVDSHIRIGAKVVERGARYALDVLLHEMVHAYCFEVLGVEADKTEKSYGWHGPKWTAQCNRIGRILGLPEVYAKGRIGRTERGPNAAHWPMCVRPAGYYGEQPEQSKPKREQKTREQSEPEPTDPLASVRKALIGVVQTADAATLDLLCAVLTEIKG